MRRYVTLLRLPAAVFARSSLAVTLLLLPAAVLAQPRIARIALLEGNVEMRAPGDRAWSAAVLHLPVLQGARLLAGSASRVEVELDDAGVFRLAPDSEGVLADYTRLSTGQRITHFALDRGVAYFSGDPDRRDAIVLSAGAVQASLLRGSRVRLEAAAESSRVSVIEGELRVYSPHYEINLREGAALRAAAGSARFTLEREIAEEASDRWSRDRDKLLPLRQGLAGLEAYGVWIDTAEYGPVWKPKIEEGWVPFREGRWQWFDPLGYTWIPREPWGWLPSHCGRWLSQPSLGWIWVPGAPAFHPGAVYWMAGRGFLGWGPLAPGEQWTAQSVPERYLAAHTTFAAAAPEAGAIDPAGFSIPIKDPLAAARFVVRPPARSVEWAERAADRPGVIRLHPDLAPSPPPDLPPRGPERRSTETRGPRPAPAPAAPVPAAGPPPAAQSSAPPSPPPATIDESYYLAPVYTGIIIMNPPERDPDKDKDPNRKDSRRQRVARPADGPVARGDDLSREAR